jgi:hypothetical protein
MVFVYYLDVLSLFNVINKGKVYYLNCSTFVNFFIKFFMKDKFIVIDTKYLDCFSKIHSNAVSEVSEFILNNDDILKESHIISDLKSATDLDVDAIFSTTIKAYSDRYISEIIIFIKLIKQHNSYEDNSLVIYNHKDKIVENYLHKKYKVRKIVPLFNLKEFLRYSRLLAFSVAYILIKRKNVIPGTYKCTTELIDLESFNKKLGEPNYVESFFNIPKKSILYFYFSQTNFGFKIKPHKITEFAQMNDINLINLNEIKSNTISKLSILRKIFSSLFFKYSFLEKKIYVEILIQWYGYTALFDNNLLIDRLVYLTFPNSNTSWRWNSGIVAAVARKHNTQTIGYQTRYYYLYDYKYMFDVYDTYYYFKGWCECNDKYDIFINRKKELKDFYPLGLPSKGKILDKSKMIVTVFPSDLSIKHHYNYAYNELFFKNVFELLDIDDNFIINIKAKDLHLVSSYMKFDSYKKYSTRYPSRIKFEDKLRGDVYSAIERADIVLGIGFTNPAIIASELGKKVLIFESLGEYHKCLDNMNIIIVDTNEEFKFNFKLLLEQKNNEKHKKQTIKK